MLGLPKRRQVVFPNFAALRWASGETMLLSGQLWNCRGQRGLSKDRLIASRCSSGRPMAVPSLISCVDGCCSREPGVLSPKSGKNRNSVPPVCGDAVPDCGHPVPPLGGTSPLVTSVCEAGGLWCGQEALQQAESRHPAPCTAVLTLLCLLHLLAASSPRLDRSAKLGFPAPQHPASPTLSSCWQARFWCLAAP